MTGLRIGVVPLPEPDRAYVEAAERMSIHSLWAGGHVLPTQDTGEAMVRLNTIAAFSERVTVGTAILLLPLYHPVLVAKQLADLDERTGGRVALGVGVGGEFPHEFEALGVSVATRGARTDEAIAVLRALWTYQEVSHDGRFFHLDRVTLRTPPPPGNGPRRRRPGGPPIYISGRGPAALRRAALKGDGFMPYLVSPRRYREAVGIIRTTASAAGRDLEHFEWLLFMYFVVRPDGDAARAEAARFLGNTYGDKPDDMINRILVAGSPDEVTVRVQQYIDAGVRHVVFAPATREDPLSSVRLAVEEVVPRLRIGTDGGA
jgi:alkanesulfonate monooxygenase SsuD/methylene tetrahydromethanopterin reductase-like flavin-dependent oxidoreductase (luciferase family)